MTELLEKKIYVSPSMVDFEGRLGYADIFALFMDLAAEHAELLGLGTKDLFPRSLFWVTVRTQAHITKRPELCDRVTLRTFPEAPGKLRCNRSYEIEDEEGNTLIRGKTEWAVMNTKTHTLVPAADLFPAELGYERESSCPEPFARIPERFDGIEPYSEYAVRSVDVDIGEHMNNTAYIRALTGTLAVKELRAMDIKSLNVTYRESCYEGDVISFQRREEGNVCDFRLSKGGGTVLLARFE